MYKKQINFGLFLLLLFIAWLFIHTGTLYFYNTETLSISKQKSNLKQQRLTYDYAKLQQDKENIEHYAMFQENETLTPVIYNKLTGEAWRFFRNRDEKNEITDEGWTPLIYSLFGEKGYTPEIAKENFSNKIKEIQLLKAKEEKPKENTKLNLDLLPDKPESKVTPNLFDEDIKVPEGYQLESNKPVSDKK